MKNNYFKEFLENYEKLGYSSNGYIAFLQQEKSSDMQKDKEGFFINDGRLIHYFDKNKIYQQSKIS